MRFALGFILGLLILPVFHVVVSIVRDTRGSYLTTWFSTERRQMMIKDEQ